MNYFSADFIDFFKELEQNNNREWFHENKSRYENSVKKPFHAFVSAVILEIQKYDSDLFVEAKDCIFRINRDIRFAKDKTPYKTQQTAFISKLGKKGKDIPGFGLRFSPDGIRIMGGCYSLSREQINAIKDHISYDISAFKKLQKDKEFLTKFGEIQGEKYKRIPKEEADLVKEEPLLMNKQFYYMGEKSVDWISSENLVEELMTYWHVARPLNQFLWDSFG